MAVHYAGTCYHPLLVFNQFGDLRALRPAVPDVHGADGWEDVLKPAIVRHQGKVWHILLPGPMPLSTVPRASMIDGFADVRRVLCQRACRGADQRPMASVASLFQRDRTLRSSPT